MKIQRGHSLGRGETAPVKVLRVQREGAGGCEGWAGTYSAKLVPNEAICI
jgi:hypothetical protein